uniref:Lipoprotein n=1 Tax=Panagrolaimus sp. PS1159 TaxID=55785 RepID=A0AC35G4E5_9BILA
MVFLSFNVCNPTFKSDLKNPVQLMTYDPNPKLKLKKIQPTHVTSIIVLFRKIYWNFKNQALNQIRLFKIFPKKLLGSDTLL